MSRLQNRNYASACLTTVVLVSIALILWSQSGSITGKEYTYVGEDYPTRLPVSLPVVAHKLRLEGSDEFSLYADDDWGSMFPQPWNGFMSLGPNNRPFTVSLYHQLHCLDTIRVEFVLNGSHAVEHVEHCLRYLRQVILCHADTTMEAAYWLEDEEGVEPASHGYGVVHTCNDWDAVKSFVEAHPVILP